MKNLLLGCAAAALLSAPALAADLPDVVAPVAPDVVAYSWTGGYVGIHGSYDFRNDDDDRDVCLELDDEAVLLGGVEDEVCNDIDDLLVFDVLTDGGEDDDDDGRFGVGVKAGYDWQFGSFVVGAVADLNWTGIGDDDDDDDDGVTIGFTPGGPGTPVTDTLTIFEENEESDWYATARLRAGFAAERVLIYGTAGLAFGFGGDDDDEFSFVAAGPNVAAIGGVNVTQTGFSDDDGDFGYAIGGGVEALVTSNVSVNLEYLYVNLDGFGDDDDDENGNVFTVTPAVPAAFPPGTNLDVFVSDEDEHDFHTVRLGVNFRFGGDTTPVASY